MQAHIVVVDVVPSSRRELASAEGRHSKSGTHEDAEEDEDVSKETSIDRKRLTEMALSAPTPCARPFFPLAGEDDKEHQQRQEGHAGQPKEVA